MAETAVTITVASRTYGEHKQYIARITGRDAKYTFAREFVGRKTNHTTMYVCDIPGLYEDCDIDRKGRKLLGYLIVTRADGNMVKMRANTEDALVIAKRLEAGESLADMLIVHYDANANKYDYTIRTKTEVKKAVAGVTVDTAIKACWEAMQALPTREAKKVLVALKAKVSPKLPVSPDASLNEVVDQITSDNTEVSS